MNDDNIQKAVVALAALVCIFVLLIASSGCSTLTPQQQRDQYVIDASNWASCQVAHSGLNRQTRTNHGHRRGFPHRFYEVQDDLRVNECRRILGEYWIEL